MFFLTEDEEETRIESIDEAKTKGAMTNEKNWKNDKGQADSEEAQSYIPIYIDCISYAGSNWICWYGPG